MTNLTPIKEEILSCANPEKAAILQRFFKTAKGEYAENDLFLGLTVPESRKIAINFKNLEFNDIENLLQSKIHEERLIALFILILQFNNVVQNRKKIFDFYLKNIDCVNNWDLVDSSADKIIGRYFFELKKVDETKKFLIKLANSNKLWHRRISVISTFYFIKKNQFEHTIDLCHILLNDKHDLIHKATGWMLREIGKRDLTVLRDFLNKNYKSMPRTTLRYAIEKLKMDERKKYLKKD